MAEIKKSVELYIVIDGNGKNVVGHDIEAVMETWREDIGDEEVGPRRVVKVILTIPLPTAIEIRGDVPEEEVPAVQFKVTPQGYGT